MYVPDARSIDRGRSGRSTRQYAPSFDRNVLRIGSVFWPVRVVPPPNRLRLLRERRASAAMSDDDVSVLQRSSSRHRYACALLYHSSISLNTTFKDTKCGVNRVRQMARMFDALAQAEADGTAHRKSQTDSQESVPLSVEDVPDGRVAVLESLLEAPDAGVAVEVFTDADAG